MLEEPVCVSYTCLKSRLACSFASVHQSFVQNSTKILLSTYYVVGEIENLPQYNSLTTLIDC